MNLLEAEQERMKELALKDLKDTLKYIKHAKELEKSLTFAWAMGYLKAKEEMRREACK